MNSFQQLPLPLRFDQSNSFEHFYSDDDFVAHSIVKQIEVTDEPLLVVTGGPDSGKSHVLNATALYCQSKKISFQYFEANMLLEYGVDIIAPCTKGHVIIIDDAHLLAKNPEWERKLYDLYNDAQRYQWVLIISITSNELLSFQLKDWASRIKAGIRISLVSTDQNSLKKIVELRSKLLGLKLKPEVIDYLLVHFSRDLSTQLKLLKQLDEQSLEQSRNITIPFVKQVFNGSRILR